MGKKSRVKTQKSGSGAMAVVSPKEMMSLIAELLQKCSSAAASAGKEWEEYLQIRGLVERIRKKQKGMSIVFEGSREDHFPDLMSWAKENGASCECFTVANFGKEGYGLRATRDIKAEELFLWIPRKMLMTVESAQNSILAPLYSQDRILQAMGNVTLALHLLCERANPASFWLPYIRSLPQEYDIPLYYQQEDVQLLLGTQAVQDVLSQYKNTARQYAYFYKLVQITTGYNLEDDRCECVALQDYKENEQIYIFYGTRSNAEFVIHNGFFFQDNAHDRVKIKLGVSKSERLYAMKAEVLARAGIPASYVFALHCNEPPISAQLLAFLRVFCMTEDELKYYLLGERAINKIFTLGNSEFPVSWENEIKLWTFLETRAALLLKTYKTTSEEDRSMLEKPDLSLHSRMAIQLRLAEKQILEKALACGRAKRLCFQKKLEEGASLPCYEESDIALLENTEADAKLPVILRKVEEGQEIQVDEDSPLLNGMKVVYGTNAEDGERDQDDDVSTDVDSALASMGSSSQREEANLSASRTEDEAKENSV
ncbi:actin-histidine N-methyltransferase [Neolamprologus brichardi]|uniref:actin-histidine N-methyltransferase n=1 Tax=Neolamprologus brichardi TaxID=32507 RepID=UPI001643B300|nr:actin-histidine N-methyltransferase [Neolamprologus brichardi]